MIDELLADMQVRMDSSIAALENDLAAIRTGRASTSLVERLPVDYYGVHTPLVQVAALSVPDAQTIMIRPYNPDDIPAIEKAFALSTLGITPQNDGKVLRLPIPPLTEARRRELSKQVGTRAEEGRVAIRNIRRDVISDLRTMEKESMITEDDLHDTQEDVQTQTQQYIDQITARAKAKEEEIMTL